MWSTCDWAALVPTVVVKFETVVSRASRSDWVVLTVPCKAFKSDWALAVPSPCSRVATDRALQGVQVGLQGLGPTVVVKFETVVSRASRSDWVVLTVPCKAFKSDCKALATVVVRFETVVSSRHRVVLTVPCKAFKSDCRP